MQVTMPYYYYNADKTVRQQLSIMTLPNFMLSLSSSFIPSSYMLLPISGTSSLPTSIYSIALSWQYSLAPKIASGPSRKIYIAHHHLLCQLSQSHWSLLLVIIYEFHSLLYLHCPWEVILWLCISFEPAPKSQL